MNLPLLLELAERDRQVHYLEAEVQRSRSREWSVAVISAIGWVLVVVTNWRYLCQLGEVLVDMVGRTVGGLL